jgi:hypothetical protein
MVEMMHIINEDLVEEIPLENLDMGEISHYHKEEDGTLRLKAHSSIFKIRSRLIQNQRFKVPIEDIHTTRIYLGKKGRGMAFSASFADFATTSGTVHYCYEMEREAIRSERKYSEGNY